MIKGRCLCGDIAYEISGHLGEMDHCHCSMCRKAHGSGFATYAMVPFEQFSWIKGEDAIGTYQSSETVARSFCKSCGSVVPTPPADGEPVVVATGPLEGDFDSKPVAHIFVGSKAEWYDITDGLAQFDGYPPGQGESMEHPRQTEHHDGCTAGSCLCGAVAFEYSGAPEFMMNCHCSRCRRAKGAAHASNVFVKADAFTWLRGEDHVVNYKLPEAERFGHAFCDVCGSSLPRQAAGAPVFNIPAGSLDDDPGVRPKAHIFVGSKAPWFEPTGDLPQHQEMPT